MLSPVGVERAAGRYCGRSQSAGNCDQPLHSRGRGPDCHSLRIIGGIISLWYSFANRTMEALNHEADKCVDERHG